jgi:hypothetical protein
MFNPESPPEFTASRWYNTKDTAPTLKGQRGKVVVVSVFQMLCPGSVKYGLPQAMRLKNAFNKDEVSVIGLHMAFENYDKQSPGKVEEFLKEQGITIPVAYDKPNGEELPETMAAYEMQGTPAILVFDRQGRLRRHYLGAVDDLRIGAEIMALLMEDEDSPRPMSIAIERRLALALTDPQEHEHGCGHDHHHEHDHEPAHAGGCRGGHGHDHEHGHTHAGAKEGCDGKGGCGCKH